MMKVYALFCTLSRTHEPSIIGIFDNKEDAHKNAMRWTNYVGGYKDSVGQYCHSDKEAGNNLAAFVSPLEINSTDRLEKLMQLYSRVKSTSFDS